MEARTLKDYACRGDQPFDMPLALGAMLEGLLGDPLLDLEDIAAF